MNNMNKARIRTVWLMIIVSILTLIFGIETPANAQIKEMIVYNKNILYISKFNNLVNIKDILYINKFNNLVNIKDIINIDIKNINNKVKKLYLINDLVARDTFLMPEYSVKLNLKSRVDNRVIISRLANAIKSQETGGVSAYYRKSYSSDACGAYQYMPGTWDNFMGYKSACLAPTWVQDKRMIHELEFNYNRFHSWTKAVAAHLMPSRADNPKTWNLRVPGNPTVQEYVNSVFTKANIAIA